MRGRKDTMVILYDFVGGAWQYFDANFVGIRVIEPQYGYDVPSRCRVGRGTFVGRRAVAYGQFASVGYIDAVHEATKQRAVGRGVMQSVVVYEREFGIRTLCFSTKQKT